MAHYKDFPKVFLGFSDIASLVLRDVNGVTELKMGGDGDYYAYECYGDVDIGEHYHLAYQAKGWLMIYDDEQRTYNSTHLNYKSCDIYRAGDYGIILHWY